MRVLPTRKIHLYHRGQTRYPSPCLVKTVCVYFVQARVQYRARVEGRSPPHIRQPPGPSREPSRMGMLLDGVMAKCSSGSSSALSTTNCESCWIVLGETAIAEVLNALRPLVHQCGAQPRVQHRCR